MKFIEKGIFVKYVLTVYLYDTQDKLIKKSETAINQNIMNIIPDRAGERLRVMIPNPYGLLPVFNHNGEHYHDFNCNNCVIDKFGIIYYQNINITFNREIVKKYAKTNLNKPEWEKDIKLDEIRKLKLEDLINIYFQTMQQGVDIELA